MMQITEVWLAHVSLTAAGGKESVSLLHESTHQEKDCQKEKDHHRTFALLRVLVLENVQRVDRPVGLQQLATLRLRPVLGNLPDEHF